MPPIAKEENGYYKKTYGNPTWKPYCCCIVSATVKPISMWGENNISKKLGSIALAVGTTSELQMERSRECILMFTYQIYSIHIGN